MVVDQRDSHNLDVFDTLEKPTIKAIRKTGILMAYSDQLSDQLHYLAAHLEHRLNNKTDHTKRAVKMVLDTVDKITAIAGDIEQINLHTND